MNSLGNKSEQRVIHQTKRSNGSDSNLLGPVPVLSRVRVQCSPCCSWLMEVVLVLATVAATVAAALLLLICLLRDGAPSEIVVAAHDA